MKAPAKKGIHRVSWDLRHASKNILAPEKESMLGGGDAGYMVTPGEYSVSMYALNKGEVNQLAEAVSFRVNPLYDQVLEPSSAAEIEAFRKALDAALLEFQTIQKVLKESSKRLAELKNASYGMEEDAGDLLEEVYRLEAEVQKLDESMHGKKTKLQVGTEEASVLENRFNVARTGLTTTYGPTSMHRENLQLGIEELKPLTEQVRTLKKTTLPDLEEKFRKAGAPIEMKL